MTKKFRVGVFIGGATIEREVSFNSGRTICDHLDTSCYEIMPIYQAIDTKLYLLPWSFLHRGKTTDFESRLDLEAKRIYWQDLKQLVDFIYIASHGHFIEDGALQGMLEVLKIPYLGSKVLASALSMDKTFQKNILKFNNIDVPNGITILPNELEQYKNNKEKLLLKLSDNKISLPCIVKPNKEGSSLGITVVHDNSELLNALEKAINIHPLKTQSAIIEEYLVGMEFTCVILTDYKTGKLMPLPPTEIVIEKNSKIFDYEQKYMPGRATKFTPARCSKEITKTIQDTCIKVMQILGFENLARIDGFVTHDNKVIITDPNILSGMAPSGFIFRQAAEVNMSHTQLINHLIETELSNYKLDKNLNLHSGSDLKTNTSESNIVMKKKIKVAVLLGGDSNERETSLDSGRNIFYKLSPEKYEAIAIFVDSNLDLYKLNQGLLVRNSTKEIAYSLKPELKIRWDDLSELANFVFIGLHGGAGENGYIQGVLETLRIPYNGSGVLTSALCMDKFKTNEYLKLNGFDIPGHLLISKEEFQANPDQILTSIESLSPYPVIIKPHDDGCSVMVKKAKNQNETIIALNDIFNSSKNFALIEEFITGMELTVGVIGNDKVIALPPSQAIATGDILSIEEKFLPGQGENQTPAPLKKEALNLVKQTIENVYKTLNCKGYSRIDCFYQNKNESPTGKERVIILEINTLPGMTPATCIFHQAAEIGLKPMDFIDLIIELGFNEHKLLSNFNLSDSLENYTKNLVKEKEI